MRSNCAYTSCISKSAFVCNRSHRFHEEIPSGVFIIVGFSTLLLFKQNYTKKLLIHQLKRGIYKPMNYKIKSTNTLV